MKNIFALSIFIALLVLTAVPHSVLAQEGDSESKSRTTAASEDPNEQMVSQGAGVPNFGCPESNKSCYKNLSHVGLNSDTAFRPSSSSGSEKTKGAKGLGD